MCEVLYLDIAARILASFAAGEFTRNMHLGFLAVPVFPPDYKRIGQSKPYMYMHIIQYTAVA